MNYEIVKLSNGDITINEAGVATIPCNMTVGIVGNPYPAFIVGGSTNALVEDYANKTVAQVTTEVNAQVAAWLAATYPNV